MLSKRIEQIYLHKGQRFCRMKYFSSSWIHCPCYRDGSFKGTWLGYSRSFSNLKFYSYDLISAEKEVKAFPTEKARILILVLILSIQKCNKKQKRVCHPNNTVFHILMSRWLKVYSSLENKYLLLVKVQNNKNVLFWHKNNPKIY